MPVRLSELLVDDSFVRYVKGTASDVEGRKWEKWMREDEKHKQLVESARKLLSDGVSQPPKPDIVPELGRLKKRIEIDRYYSWLDQRTHSRKRRSWSPYAMAASVLLIIGLMVWSQFIQNDGTTTEPTASITYRTLTTDYGDRKSVHFSDGSTVILNAHSQIRLPEQTSGKDTMHAWLQGEAHFSIQRHKASSPRTFIVHTEDGEVSVLGTKFVVNTHDDHTQVVLSEGQVRVQVKDSLEHPGRSHEMKPGELALFSSREDSIKIKVVNPEVYTSWIDSHLILDETPVSVLIRRIELTHGLNIVVKDQNIMREKLTGKLKNYDLDMLLKGMENALGVRITRDKQMLFIESDDF